MSLAHLLADALRAALLLGLALAALPLLRRAPAEARRIVLPLALGGAPILPVASAVVPACPPPAWPALPLPRGEPYADPLRAAAPLLTAEAPAAVRPQPHARQAARLDLATLAGALWAI